MKLNNLKKTPFLIFLIAALTFLAYSFALQGWFKTMDDEISIVKNVEIRSFANIGKILSSSFFGDKSYHRPLVSISFMFDYHFWGLNALYYYLTNIWLHILNAILVFFLIRRMTASQTIAFWTALLFALHPVQWEAVSNIPGRSNLLCAFFYLVAFILFQRQTTRDYLLSFFCFFLALLSKESAGVLPLVLFIYIVLFHRPSREGWKSALLPLTGYLAIEGGYVLIRKVLGIVEVFHWETASDAFLGFVTFLRGVITFFRLLIFPVDLQFDRARQVFFDFNPEAGLTILFFMALLAVIIVWRKKIPAVVLFLIAWFFIDLLPVSQIFASIGVQPGYISIAEHFLYMPSIPALALIVLGIHRLYEINRQRKMISLGVFQFGLAGLFLFFYLLTIQHNIYSSNEIAMFERTLAVYPDNIRIRNSLARSYARLGRYAEAEYHFRKTLELFPGGAWARIGLGKVLCDQGRYWEGLAQYESVYDPGQYKELLEENIKLTYQALLHDYQRKLQMNPDVAGDHYGLGIVYSKTGRLQEAIAEFEKAVRLAPDFQDAWFNLSSAYEADGQWTKAAQGYERFLELGMNKEKELLIHACRHLAQIYEKLADSAKARKYNSLAERLSSP